MSIDGKHGSKTLIQFMINLNAPLFTPSHEDAAWQLIVAQIESENNGAKRPVLIHGPAGCGKTFLLRRLNQQQYNFQIIQVDPAYLGDQRAKNLRHLFELLEEKEHQVLVFDDSETPCGSEYGIFRQPNEVILCELLNLHLRATRSHLSLVVLTNLPWDIPSQILSYFGRAILVEPPSEALRENLIKIGFQEANCELDEAQVMELGAITKNFTISDIISSIRKALMCQIQNKDPENAIIVPLQFVIVFFAIQETLIKFFQQQQPCYSEQQLQKYQKFQIDFEKSTH